MTLCTSHGAPCRKTLCETKPDEDTIAARLDRIEAQLAALASVLRDDAT
jgi:hypothetical protein